MKQPGADFFSPNHMVTSSIEFAGTHLHTWEEKGTVRVRCLAQDQNTMSLTRAQTHTCRSEVERTEAIALAAPPQI